MTTKQIKRGMTAGAVGVLLLAVGVVAWAALTPVAVPVSARPAADTGGDTPHQAQRPTDNPPTLAELSALSAIDLRRPLHDKPVIPPPPTPLRARLKGTMYELTSPEKSMAIFILADGSEKWFRAGQTFDDPAGEVTVQSVGDQKAKVRYRGEERELVAGSP